MAALATTLSRPQDHPPLPDFDRVARLYRWAEYLALGPLLTRTRNRFLPRLAGVRRAVLFGDGDGRFLAAFLRQNATAHATAVDISPRMLQILQARCRPYDRAGRFCTVRADALDYICPAGTDLVVTHFFLDCLTQPQVDLLAQRLSQMLPSGALWLVSDFCLPARGPLRPFAGLYIRSLYLVFRLLTGLQVQRLPDPQRALRSSGFTCIAAHRPSNGMLYTELWQLRCATHAAEPLKSSTVPMTDIDQTLPEPLENDAIPDPEPIAPSLGEPDPGVFHHDVPAPAGDTPK